MAGPIEWLRRTFADPRISRHLLADEGEVVVDEVRHHWVVYIIPGLLGLVALVLVGATLNMPLELAWLTILPAIAIAGYAAWRCMEWYMDRFVISNMRVFRVSGVFNKKVATTPIMRILDITVDKPLIGRMFGFGHFIFESAAQEQGLRDIRYVGRPDQRDLTIQRILQRSGLRATAKEKDENDDDEGEATVPSAEETPVGIRKRADHPRLPGSPSARRVIR